MKEEQMLCPRVDCKNHVEDGPGNTDWLNKHGHYWNRRLKKRIQRFRCKDCGKTFSVQTFSVDYWIKITVDYRELEILNATIETVSQMAHMKAEPTIFIKKKSKIVVFPLRITRN